jgi:2-keto-myo-inositol isomerase
MDRRKVLQVMGVSGAAAVLANQSFAAEKTKKKSPFTYCLNMATIRGHKLGFEKEIQTASAGGYRSVEVWMDSLQAFLKTGRSIADARKIVNDNGITVENCIGFASWIVDDDAARKSSHEQLKNEMDLLREIGCNRIAAPPVGATNIPLMDLKRVAERFRDILELGDKHEVIPQLELWGFSKNLSKVAEVMYVAVESGHPSAKVLLDSYHIYKGGSAVDTLPLVGTAGVEVFHINDYPSTLSPEKITDADRVYPGDGVGPLRKELEVLKKTNQPLVVSVEVFNPEYYKQDALLVTKTSLQKLKAVLEGV